MDDGYSFGFGGDQTVKCADVALDGDGMAMLFQISGGKRAFIEAQLMIVMNSSSSYLICCVGDYVPWICYRTGPEEWKDQKLTMSWNKEPRTLLSASDESKRIRYIDNWASHSLTLPLQLLLETINNGGQLSLQMQPVCWNQLTVLLSKWSTPHAGKHGISTKRCSFSRRCRPIRMEKSLGISRILARNNFYILLLILQGIGTKIETETGYSIEEK